MFSKASKSSGASAIDGPCWRVAFIRGQQILRKCVGTAPHLVHAGYCRTSKLGPI